MYFRWGPQLAIGFGHLELNLGHTEVWRSYLLIVFNQQNPKLPDFDDII